MYQIEEELTDRLTSSEAQLAGRITTQNRREFYFYAATEADLKRNVDAAFQAFPTYEFSMGMQRDELWSHYFEVLYPSPRDLERIKNNDLLYVLAEQGDVHAVPRRVLHWIHFAEEGTRNLFRAAAVDAGFEFDDFYRLEEQGVENPFVIVVAKFQSIEKPLIDETSIQLLELATRFQGEYTGWETPVVTQ